MGACGQVDVSLSPLEALALYGRSAVLEQCLAYIGSAGAAAASSSSDDILHIVLPLLQEALGEEEPLVCTAALRQLPAVGVPSWVPGVLTNNHPLELIRGA